MSEKQYFDSSDYLLFWAYRQAFIDNLREKTEHDNFIAWLSGKYIQSAVGSLLSKENEYMDEPIQLFSKHLSEKQKREELIKQDQKIKSHYTALFTTMEISDLREKKLREKVTDT